MALKVHQNERAARNTSTVQTVEELTLRESPNRSSPPYSCRSRLAAALLLVATSVLGGCQAQPFEDANEEDFSEEAAKQDSEDKLLQGVIKSQLWQSKTVTYCFPTPQLSEMPSSVRSVVSTQSALVQRWRSRIQEFVGAVDQTWGAARVLDLRWQEACGNGMVRVSYSRDTPTGGYAQMGQRGGVTEGVHMDSDFLGNTYPTGRNNYHTYTAAHEWGHVLGFEHEQNHRDSTCSNSRDSSGAGIVLSAYDPNSIMNYCNSQRTELTALDRAGFAKAYAFLGGGTPGGTTGGDPGGTTCSDKNTSCANWARSGECTKNPSYMLPNCAASCRQCTPGGTTGGDPGGTTSGTTCRDSNTSCAVWARSGECTRNPSYMRTSCCTSCKGR